MVGTSESLVGWTGCRPRMDMISHLLQSCLVGTAFTLLIRYPSSRNTFGKGHYSLTLLVTHKLFTIHLSHCHTLLNRFMATTLDLLSGSGP